MVLLAAHGKNLVSPTGRNCFPQNYFWKKFTFWIFFLEGFPYRIFSPFFWYFFMDDNIRKLWLIMSTHKEILASRISKQNYPFPLYPLFSSNWQKGLFSSHSTQKRRKKREEEEPIPDPKENWSFCISVYSNLSVLVLRTIA